MSVGHQIWRGSTRFGGPTIFFFFEIRFSGPHWAFSHCHVAAHDWATWQPTIGPCQPPVQSPATSCHLSCHIILPHHPATSPYICHVVVRTATWHFFIGPRIDPKNPKMSDTWQPLVLPHHHVVMLMST
jgi:hypothetical protein